MADDRIAIQTLGLTGRLFFELYESVRIFGTYLLWKGLRLFCAAALASSLLLTGCGVTTPLVNPQEQSAPAQITQSQMHNAIIRAAQLRKWRIVSDQPGVLSPWLIRALPKPFILKRLSKSPMTLAVIK